MKLHTNNKQTQMQLNKLKAEGIFLDLDGTIVDSTEAYIEAARIAFQAIGKKAPAEATLLEIPRRIEQYKTIDDITEGYTREFLPIYLHAYHSIAEQTTRLLPNILSTLETLSKKSKLALITMRHVPKEVIWKELGYLGINKYFNQVITALDTPKPKPSPQPLIKCVETLKLNLQDCIIAGDSINDVRAGKAAGVKTVAVLSGLYCRETLEKEKPDLLLPDISALIQHIE